MYFLIDTGIFYGSGSVFTFCQLGSTIFVELSFLLIGKSRIAILTKINVKGQIDVSCEV